MKNYFGYIRVSTAKQGTQGVSLQEQREAISRFADKNSFNIVTWYEERVTAAKSGRPVFSQMLQLLRAGKASGVVIHKIDRSARNLKDWADLGELMDSGTEVHIANESLDLHSRGGRLSADIQAVVAADFIRNLREETKKGYYGRLKQGLYPRPAPIGYLNVGKGKPKALDPIKAPLIRRAFELYSTGRYSLENLSDEMFRAGLRNTEGRRFSGTRMSEILRNLFYSGIILIKKSGDTFPGIHKPIVPKSLFDRVQELLHGRMRRVPLRNEHIFRRLVTCSHCQHHLIGEKQKQFVYYRCHGKECPVTCIREDIIECKLLDQLQRLQFNEEESAYLKDALQDLRQNWDQQRDSSIAAITLAISQTQDRLNRLTDAYIDRLLDKESFQTRKMALLSERRESEDKLDNWRDSGASVLSKLEEILELAKSAYSTYKMGFPDEKRELVQAVTSNFWVDQKNVVVMLNSPFNEVVNHLLPSPGDPSRSTGLTWREFLENLIRSLNLNKKLVMLPKSRNAVEVSDL